MTGFIAGFQKIADMGSTLKRVGKSTMSAGKALASGVSASMSSSVGDALNLKGLGNISKAVNKAGGLGKAVSTVTGRKGLAEGIGKAAPSLAAGTAYAVGAKKLYDKTLGSPDESSYY